MIRNVTVLKPDNRLRPPFLFEAKYTRKNSISNWDLFFKAVVKEFREGIGSIERDTLEEFQMELVEDIVMWLRHLIVGKNFSRGNARAIEELLADVAWYGVVGWEKIKPFFDDIQRGFDKLHNLWREDRDMKLEVEIALHREKLKKHRELILKDVPSPERDKFSQIVMKSKRTNEGKIIYSDVARRCKTEFTQGIAGRKVDDKFAKELCKVWNLK